MLGFSTIQGAGGVPPHAVMGLLAAAGASLMWGTMYVPYRKAYLSGMNPLSFVTVFTVGELGTMFLLTWTLDGGMKSSAFRLMQSRQLLFWLFLGGFVWVVGDLFQQFATKYLGIGRGIPLSNTNQFWGLAWGALVFGELASANRAHLALVLGGSVLMILGALAISTAVASSRENHVTERGAGTRVRPLRTGLWRGAAGAERRRIQRPRRTPPLVGCGDRRGGELPLSLAWAERGRTSAGNEPGLDRGADAGPVGCAGWRGLGALATDALRMIFQRFSSRSNMAVRLKDIAADLGVSTVTVSKVLRGGLDIGERTRARVLKRMAELNYQPNMQARGLASGRSFAVGLVVPDLVHPFFGEFAKSLAGALRAERAGAGAGLF